jgi:hypothetical protein
MTTRTDEMDDLTAEIVGGLDLVPIPTAGSAARRRQDRSRRNVNLSMVAAFVLVGVLTVTVAAPDARAALAEGVRLVERMIRGGSWSGYYVEFTQDATGAAQMRLRFAAGRFPGRNTRPEIVLPGEFRIGEGLYLGGWSQDQERFGFVARSSVYIGDRDGNVKRMTDPLGLVFGLGWSGPRRFAVAVDAHSSGAETLIVRVDVDTGQIERIALPYGFGDALIGAGRVQFSPDGRWMSWDVGVGGPAPSCGPVFLHELGSLVVTTQFTGDDGGWVIGWLRDGRVATARCAVPPTVETPPQLTGGGAATEVFISDPRGDRSRLASFRRGYLSWSAVDQARDRIVYVLNQETTTIGTIDVNGRIERLADLGSDQIVSASLTADGRSLSFARVVPRPLAAGRHIQLGLMDLGTGRVEWACPETPDPPVRPLSGCGPLDWMQ